MREAAGQNRSGNKLVGIRSEGWNLLCAPGHLPLAPELQRWVEERVRGSKRPTATSVRTVEVLRDDYRSLVALLELGGRRIVAKSPRLKNRSRWMRVLSLFRRAEAADTVRRLWELRRRDVPLPEPILAMERRSAGRVVDSWLFYLYAEGSAAGAGQIPQVVRALESLHQAGWVHGDPHPQNFIWDGSSIHMIDCRPKRARLGAVSRCYDFVLLESGREGVVPHLPVSTTSTAYRLALLYDRWIKGWRRAKKSLRSAVGRPRSTGAPGLPRCRLCGGTDLRLAYTQGNERQFRFYRCGDCRLVNYDLSTGLNQEKYAGEPADPRDAAHRRNRGQASTYEFVRRKIRTRGRLLNIGCGNGRLLYLAKQDGWSVEGVELSPALAESVGRELGIKVTVADFLEYDIGASVEGEAGYDLVFLRHVLEHLPDARLAMEKIHRLLRPGGLVILEFPNVDALDLRIKRFLHAHGRPKRYAADYVPGHCNEFCRRSFATLARRTGFLLEDWSTYSTNPMQDRLYRAFPIGNKARALVRRAGER